LTKQPRDTRSPEAKAYQWASRIMTISLEMVVPGLVGYWLDQKLGTKAVLTILGFGLGTTLGIWHLIQIGNAPPPGSSNESSHQ
jgi:F0F1-type ATP synthase assembly protein I